MDKIKGFWLVEYSQGTIPHNWPKPLDEIMRHRNNHRAAVKHSPDYIHQRAQTKRK